MDIYQFIIYINRFGIKDRQNCKSIQEARTYSNMVDTSWYMPLLFQQKTGGGWTWISEAMNAAVDGPSYAACHAVCSAKGAIKIGFDKRHGSDSPVKGLRQTPWRVVLLSESLSSIVESTIIENLTE
jgi:hypothetical protein